MSWMERGAEGLCGVLVLANFFNQGTERRGKSPHDRLKNCWGDVERSEHKSAARVSRLLVYGGKREGVNH